MAPTQLPCLASLHSAVIYVWGSGMPWRTEGYFGYRFPPSYATYNV